MSLYEYHCEECGIIFEEVLLTKEDTEKYSASHPCSQCGKNADRIPVSKINFQFKGTPGNSGSHDLDYPTADKAVGRSAARKWEKIHREQEARDRVRQDTGQAALASMADGSAAPVDPKLMKMRDQGHRILKSGKDAIAKGEGSVVDPRVVRQAMEKE